MWRRLNDMCGSQQGQPGNSLRIGLHMVSRLLRRILIGSNSSENKSLDKRVYCYRDHRPISDAARKWALPLSAKPFCSYPQLSQISEAVFVCTRYQVFLPTF